MFFFVEWPTDWSCILDTIWKGVASEKSLSYITAEKIIFSNGFKASWL